MHPRHLALMALIAALAQGACAQAPAVPNIAKAFGLQGYRISYQDEAGRPLSAAAFNARAAQGQSMSLEKDEDRKTALLSLSAQSKAAEDGPALTVKVGEPVPELSGTLMDGQPSTLLPQGEHYTLLAFFFARCVPCVAEIADLNHLSQTRTDLRVVGVTFDPVQTTRALAKRYGIRYATLSAAKPSIEALNVRHYPTLLLVRPDGTLAAMRQSASLRSDAASRAKLNAWLNQALSGPAPRS